MIRKILVLFAVSFLAISLSAQTTYYIDAATGNDSDDGLSLGNAWLTIGKANTTLTAGDTVYVRAGTYNSMTSRGGIWAIINPTNSGTSGNYITYQNYNSEQVYITSPDGERVHGISLRDSDYITVDGIDTGSTLKFWILLEATSGNTCQYNIVQNCVFDGNGVGGSPWAGVWFGSTDGDNRGTIQYNQLLDCDFVNVTCQPDDIIYFVFGDCYYNLIQGCTFDGGPHVAIEMQTSGKGEIKWNIIRQNTIRNENHTGVNIYYDSDWNLVEDNVIYDCGDDYANNGCGTQEDRDRPRWNHGSIVLGSSNTIVRRNRMYNNGAFHFIASATYSTTSNNRIYHNTQYTDVRGVYAESSGQDCTGNIFKNNIMSDSSEHEVYHNIDTGNRDNRFTYNCFYNNTGNCKWEDVDNRTVAYLETNYSTQWNNNSISDPTFVNVAGKDFTLLTGSPCIDTGDWLTTITSANGSGTSFVVDDASYFCNGWGIITGDEIQLEGDSSAVGITSINYGTNTITVDESVSWTQGDGVALEFKDSAPDMGAYEYDGESPPEPVHATVLGSGVKVILKSGVKWVIK